MARYRGIPSPAAAKRAPRKANRGVRKTSTPAPKPQPVGRVLSDVGRRVSTKVTPTGTRTIYHPVPEPAKPKRKRKAKAKAKPSRGGHPSRGGVTAGGGTTFRRKGKTYETPISRYKSPTPDKALGSVGGVFFSKGGKPTVIARTAGGGTRKLSVPKFIDAAAKGADEALQRSVEEGARGRPFPTARPGPKDKDTKLLGFNIEAELEGRGGIAKAAEATKGFLTSDSVLGKATRKTALRAAGLPVQNDKLEKAIVRDIVDIPTQAVPGVYAVGAAGFEEVKGRPQRRKQLVKEFVEQDPFALAAQGKFGEAAKAAEKHPLLTGLELYGGGAAVSRAAGIGARAGLAGARGKRAGSRARAPKVNPDTAMKDPRTWSRGLGAKAVQVAVERRKIKKAERLRAEADRQENPKRRSELRREAAEADPRIMTANEIARRVDEREPVAEIRRRAHRADAIAEVREALPKDTHADVALLVGQHIIGPNRAALQGFKRDLEDVLEGNELSRAQRAATFQLHKQVDEALDDKSLDWDKVKAAAKRYGEVTGERQRGMVEREILAPERERMAKLIPVAVREMGARWDYDERQLLGDDGEPLTAEMIEQHLLDTGRDPADVVYVTQAPGQKGPGAYYQSWHQGPREAGGPRRTGEATRLGAFEVGRDVAEAQVARQQGMIDVFDEYTGFVAEHALRDRGEGPARKGVPERVMDFESKREADDYKLDNLADSPYDWQAVPTRPLFGREEISEELLARAGGGDPAADRTLQRAIEMALEGEAPPKGAKAGRWVLVPKPATDRMRQHAGLLGSPFLKGTRQVGRQFSGVVLTTQGVTWPLGNVTEGALRATLIRAGPMSWRLARKTIAELEKIDPARAEELRARVGTGAAGAMELMATHTTAKDYAASGPFVKGLARTLGTMRRVPGPQQVGKLWNWWTHQMFDKNGLVESQIRTAMLGRYLRETGFNPNKLRVKEGARAFQTAAEQAAKGMVGTDEQVAAARFIRRAYGQYEAFGPAGRWMISVFTPFIAWYLNALKFLGDVLPRDHPVLVGLIAASERASEEWRNEHGLGKLLDQSAPDFMQSSIPVGDGKLMPALGRYTPFGVWNNPAESLAGQVLPQFNSTLMAFKGLDWKGDPLNDKDRRDDVSQGERYAAAGQQFLGTFIPFFSLGMRVADKGVGGALNPAPAYTFNPKTTAAYNEIDRIEKAKTKIIYPNGEDKPARKINGKKVSADNPTPEYARLHKRYRRLQKLIHAETKGTQGQTYKNPYRPRRSGGGGGWDLSGSEDEDWDLSGSEDSDWELE